MPDVCHFPLWALRAGAVGNETLLGPGLALQASLQPAGLPSTYPLTPLSVDPVQKGKGSDRGGGDAGFDR